MIFVNSDCKARDVKKGRAHVVSKAVGAYVEDHSGATNFQIFCLYIRIWI